MLAERLKKALSDCVLLQEQDEGDVIGLPFPYSVPTPGERFHCLFYWDTYFTNLGLLESGNWKQAMYNVTDMLTLVEQFGFMPNGNRARYLRRSQPPFLSLMVRDIYEHTRDREWLRRAYVALTKEHTFWYEKRGLGNGLSHYGYIPESDMIAIGADRWRTRSGVDSDAENALLAGRYMTNAESGWDMNPRWGLRAWEYAPPDLNALLWSLESNLAVFAEILENGEADSWRCRAEERKRLMTVLLWDPQREAFMDRNCKTGAFGEIFSVASFYPLFVGMADGEQAEKTMKKLSLLEHAKGVCPCESHNKAGVYQWDSPNLWPCLQWIVCKALKNYGYDGDARRIGQKYISVVEINEAKTGQLWEKYNADSGFCDVIDEYPMPPMLGWSAGVYLKLKSMYDLREGREQ